MPQIQELNSMNDFLSVSMLNNYQNNRYPQLNSRQRDEKNAGISLANWFLRCVKTLFIPHDFFQHTDRVVDRIAYSEAVKYF